jgi:hypothetical protein
MLTIRLNPEMHPGGALAVSAGVPRFRGHDAASRTDQTDKKSVACDDQTGQSAPGVNAGRTEERAASALRLSLGRRARRTEATGESISVVTPERHLACYRTRLLSALTLK